ncbi:hypothetical protein CDO44_14560 [Pigmentiphaga sp. NML080357]|uniref:HdeD family acid-resistance protein n=1 Tax=Pigmentiphaga sp. NML080357 TaxID=2008675 RepID=UPI000B41D92A|nr:HdeD family acid-resistance protein [Pigmentiphaga sp. NML080357]OVZ58455.1 hypothetical protein CDO44_14560 [Pigmentiphaga sp. NML080357]
MADASNPTPVPGSLSWPETLKTLGASWGWFVALGVLMLILGFVAGVYVLAATVASVLFVGVMMLVAGIGQLVQAWRVKGWRGFLLWTLSGLLYAIAGGLALYNPLAGAAVLTLLLGAFLIAAGVLRLWVWFQHRSQQGWGWLALSGVITLLAGLLVAVGWPANSLWILGLLLAIDLLFQGATLVMLGLALRRGLPAAPPPGNA